MNRMSYTQASSSPRKWHREKRIKFKRRTIDVMRRNSWKNQRIRTISSRQERKMMLEESEREKKVNKKIRGQSQPVEFT